MKLVIIYHLPYSTYNPVMVRTFIPEFNAFLEAIMSPQLLMITDDCNIHIDDPNDVYAVEFFGLWVLCNMWMLT